ncbi:signal transduction histidine kinase [Actinomadura pelletieri DSM 43383]|uniref:Signal transduction histidine kinase n=1 Tax=Actinomadura pelletieri DSM 43383 TaxID=1120940 RepID=A0A495QSY7_9ACTN|nr:histidine kinase [Actinomadura pelletieri]RKS76622.1 signal transduction histidine kinase [Actinomadura pelletieri DSM 43383]
MLSAFRLARLVAVVVSVGFSYGGFIGISRSGDPAHLKALGCGLLASLLLLHLYNCVRTSDGRRPRAWQWTLAAQAVFTGVGLHLFASTWYGNTGFLAAAVLLLIRPVAAAWAGFAVIVVVQFVSGLGVRPTVWEAAYLAIGHAAFVGVALYGVARFADLVGDLERTRTALADAEVARERLAFTQQLNDRVGRSLEAIVHDGEAASTSPGAPAARELLTDRLALARSALNETRSVAHSHRDGAPAPTPATCDLTATVVTGLGVAAAVLLVLSSPIRSIAQADASGGEIALYLGALAVFLGLFLWCVRNGDDDGRPRLWRLALGAAFVVALAPELVFEREIWYLSLYLPALTLVLLRGWLRWAVTVPLIAQDLLTFLLLDVTIQGTTFVDQTYGMVWVGERALVIYGFARMGRLARELRDARLRLATVEVARERLRFARDLHDLLGFTLSVIVLKSELALRMLDRDAARAHRELDDGLAAARQALADIEIVATGYREVSLEDEVASARSILVTAGYAVDGTVDTPRLTTEQSTVLATVLREGVTNVLRHSDGTRCTLDVGVVGSRVRLRLRNDGVRPSALPPGTGLDNLAYRVRAVGGFLKGEAVGDSYVLTAEIPLTAEEPGIPIEPALAPEVSRGTAEASPSSAAL